MPNLYCLDRSLDRSTTVGYTESYACGLFYQMEVVFSSKDEDKTRQGEARRISEIILSEKVIKYTFRYILCNRKFDVYYKNKNVNW